MRYRHATTTAGRAAARYSGGVSASADIEIVRHLRGSKPRPVGWAERRALAEFGAFARERLG